jgi:hypothetical protein
MGTPITALMAVQHGSIPRDMVVTAAGMFLAAFLPPTLRVIGFGSGVTAMVVLHFRSIMNPNLAAQLVCYAVGAYAFLR